MRSTKRVRAATSSSLGASPRVLERGTRAGEGYVEIISPAGFERYFEELTGILSRGGPPDVPGIEALAARYGPTFHWERMEGIMEKYRVGLG